MNETPAKRGKKPKAKPRPGDLLDTPAKRRELAPRNNPYWLSVGPKVGGLKLGFRKPVSGPGAWIVKIVTGGDRAQGKIGTADDHAPGEAPQAGSLSFESAVRAAGQWLEGRKNAKARAEQAQAKVTVGDAVLAYIAGRESRDAHDGRDARLRLERHVLSAPLSAVALTDLRSEHLETWRVGLVRGGRAGAKAAKRGSPVAPLAAATVDRLLNDLRAALNAAREKYRRVLPPALTDEIAVGTKAPAHASSARDREKVQPLEPMEVARLVRAAADVSADFGALVLVLAATGARYSQAARLRVEDVQVEGCRIMLPVSKKGAGGKTSIHTPVPVGEDVVAALRPLLQGRKGNEVLLLRAKHEQQGFDATTRKPVWVETGRRPWIGTAELTRPWNEALKRAGLSETLVPYVLRASNIVRLLKARVSVSKVAALHDTSAAMIQKHYARWIAHTDDDVVRNALAPIAPPQGGPVLRVVGGL